MGGISGQDKSPTDNSSTQITRDANSSTVVDASLGGTVSLTNLVGSDGNSITMTDFNSVTAAMELARESLAGNTDFLGDVLDSVNKTQQRNYDFAENVAIPLSGQITEDFTKYALIVSGLVAISFIFLSTKKGRA